MRRAPRGKPGWKAWPPAAEGGRGGVCGVGWGVCGGGGVGGGWGVGVGVGGGGGGGGGGEHGGGYVPGSAGLTVQQAAASNRAGVRVAGWARVPGSLIPKRLLAPGIPLPAHSRALRQLDDSQCTERNTWVTTHWARPKPAGNDPQTVAAPGRAPRRRRPAAAPLAPASTQPRNL